ncbi:dihydrodipicolinate synthase family protein [Microbacterium sp. Leaf159]|uniref:dihydrodipicolinate synthase family protein n=1 Tax=Microbacterium sp. Leaf159 TaxID=1736279 RepID=UPI0006F25FF9|nr:dihydrodipicolinate synthase family protein [Microbacterium sp. Leaf159]KQR39421.1 1,5-anhydro-D-fructose reductase [Microbacterium sp. Leaf159]
MTPVQIAGVCPVVETPFTADGEIHPASMEQLIDRLLHAGVRAVMYPGFASEFYKLSEAERDMMTGIVIERMHQVEGTVVVVSVPDHATDIAVRRARAAVAAGADMINILPPHQHGPSSDAVAAHVRAILRAIAPTPAILQYAPAQTGTTLTSSMISEMARENPNLVQVKVESAPPGRLISALDSEDPRLDSIVGYAGVQLIDALTRGAVAVQPGSSFPEIYLRIWDLWQTGDRTAARELHTRLLPYISYWMQSIELIIAAEKRISQLRGLIESDLCRAPARTLDAQELVMIDAFLEEFADLLG